jgi:DNA polymerase III sliding clamp (beta) subunit (PCNA family)
VLGQTFVIGDKSDKFKTNSARIVKSSEQIMELEEDDSMTPKGALQKLAFNPAPLMMAQHTEECNINMINDIRSS